MYTIDDFFNCKTNTNKPYGVIYKITNLRNGKMYVGQTTQQPPERRWSQHQEGSRKNNKMAICRAIKKHGVNNFKFEVIAKCYTLDELNTQEIHYIATNNTLMPKGYNASKGGDNYEKSPETCKKISDANKISQKGRIITKEAREKLRACNLGKKQSAETIAKKSAARKGVPWSERKRQSMAGYNHSEETKQKMSTKQKGRQFSNETKQKMREAKQAVRKLTDQQVAEIKENKDQLPQCELAKQYNVSKQLINNIVNGKRGY